MNRKPSRPFVYLALMMVFLLVIGLVVVGVLIGANPSPSAFELTASHIIGTNAVIAKTNTEPTIHFAATLTRVTVSDTPIAYTADMSPTALPQEFYRTPPPYDAELYAMRQSEARGLITSGGPTQYAIFYATETELVRAYYDGATLHRNTGALADSDTFADGAGDTHICRGGFHSMRVYVGAARFARRDGIGTGRPGRRRNRRYDGAGGSVWRGVYRLQHQHRPGLRRDHD